MSDPESFCLYAPFFHPSGYGVAAHMDALSLSRVGAEFQTRATHAYADGPRFHGESHDVVKSRLTDAPTGTKRWLRDEPVSNVPAPGLRVAWAPFRECQRWPREWAAALNAHASVVVTPAAWLSDGARGSGVEVPIVECPVAWDWYQPYPEEVHHLAGADWALAFGPSWGSIWRDAGFAGEIGSVPDGATPPRVLWDGAFYSRKNLENAVRAFWRAFPKAGDAEMLMRVSAYHADHMGLLWGVLYKIAREVTMNVGGLARVRWIHDSMPMDKIQALHLGADVYLSLARAEGVGYGALIAAGWGKPCVLTDEPGLCATVPHALFAHSKQVPARAALAACPVQAGGRPIFGMDNDDPWWEADVESAAELLKLAANRHSIFGSDARVRAGRIVANHSPEEVGRRIVEIMEAL